MNVENLQQVWAWLLSLSKVQLILLGGGVSLLVAVSKIMRFVFLLGILIIFLTAVMPELIKRYNQSPLPEVVREIVRRGAEATQDPVPTHSDAKNDSVTQEGK
jgi:hypothetical protein